MSTKCAYHPGVSASHACMQCGALICGDCKRRVQNKPACWRCAGEEAAPVVSAPETTPEPVAAQAETPTAEQSPQPYFAKKTQTLDFKKVVRGVLIATLISFVGAVVWEKIAFYTGKQYPYVNLLLGIAIGVAVRGPFGKPNDRLAIVSGLIAVLGLFFAHWLLLWDITTARLAPGYVDISFITKLGFTWKILPEFLHDLSFVHWLCCAFCVVTAFTWPSSLIKEKL